MVKSVHIYPVPGVSIPGVPAIEQDVSAEQWLELQSYVPPAFTTDPPQPTETPQDASPEPTEDTV